MAEEAGLDLVEIVPNADPPVCRVMDFGKFKFEQQKKAHAAKRKTKQVEIKELKFRPSTDDGDYDVKMRNLRRFLAGRRQGQDRHPLQGPRDGSHGAGARRWSKRIESDVLRGSGDRVLPAPRRAPDGDDDRPEEE